MTDPKSFLVINRKSPYGSAYAREALDVSLIVATFGQPLSMLFMDDGVFQLLDQQDPGDIEQKNSSQTLPMLEMYDVKDIYVEAESLSKRGLRAEELVIPVQVIDSAATARLIDQQDILLSF